MATETNLRQRGRQWYLQLGIPRSLRHHFLSHSGKPMATIEQPLGDSFEQARIECARRVANYRELFSRLKAGEPIMPEEIKQALSFNATEFDRVRRETAIAMRQFIQGPPPDALPRELLIQTPLFPRDPYMGARNLGLADAVETFKTPAAPMTIAPTSGGETISQAAEAWLAELSRDKSAAPRAETLKGHRDRVRAFVDKCGDLPLTSITRAIASDFLDGLHVSRRTRNNYAQTLKCVFKCAGRRGRFSNAEEDNPFTDQRAKVVAGSSYEPFTVEELQKLFDALPRDTAPAKHSPETALPWAALIALYSGARLEEIAQLRTSDIREEAANGATVWVIDIHNGGDNKLKNESSARLVPVHSALVRAGLLDYVKALPKAGPLFPGLTRRASKGGKIGARLGELFRKRLVALGLKRDGLCFHSFRHTVAGRLDAAGVPQADAARVLGHAVAGMSYGTYSQAGPGLKRVAGVVEQITYEGLRL
jgi:integrase